MKRFSLYRMYRIVAMAVKFFLQIYFFQKKYKGTWGERTSEQWERLLKKQAETYKATSLELEGLLIKVGQFLSTRADLLPRVFLDELEGLVDQVPSLPWEDAKATLEEGWGVPYERYLQYISDGPVASASIGEVYQGSLHSGEIVAVKIRRRGIDRIMKIDFKALRIVVWMVVHFTSIGKKFNFQALYRELVRVTTDELDFTKELENGQYFRREFEDNDDVYIPRYYREYTSRKVLVMEWIDGAKVTNHSFLKKHAVDPKALGDMVFNCFAKQFLDSGKFHADPHSGNVFVQEDGTLVLLDFGMVSEIDKNAIIYFRELIEGILFEDYRKVFEALENLGFLLPSADKRELEHAIKSVLDLYVNHKIDEIDSDMMEEILAEVMGIVRRQPIQLPSEFGFLGRAISVLVGLLFEINPSIDFLETARPIVNQWMRDDENTAIPNSKFQYVKDWARPFLQYPVLIKDFLQAPQQAMEWAQTSVRQTYIHENYVARKRYAMISFFIGIVALFISLFFDKWGLAYGSAIFSLIAAGLYMFHHLRHKRWIKTLKGRR